VIEQTMFGHRRSRFLFGKATIWWLGIAVAIGLIGWSKAINLLLILGFVLPVLLVCQGFAARGITRRIRLIPIPGTTVFAGEAATIAFEISNPSSQPATFHIDGPHGLHWFYPQLAGGNSVRGSGQVVVSKRGLHALGRYAIVSSYPFGILEYRCDSAPVSDVCVLPSIGTIHERLFRQWLKTTGYGESRQPRTANRSWIADGDVRGIRPFRTGDNPKDVHWKSTARRGTLFVREYDSTPPKDLLIIAEAYSPEGAAEYPPLEIALSLATTLAWEWVRWDGNLTARILLLTSGGETMIRAIPGNPSSMRELAKVTGSKEADGQPWVRHAKILRQTHRVFVSSLTSSSWPARFAASGFPVMLADSGAAWYRPSSATNDSH